MSNPGTPNPETLSCLSASHGAACPSWRPEDPGLGFKVQGLGFSGFFGVRGGEGLRFQELGYTWFHVWGIYMLRFRVLEDKALKLRFRVRLLTAEGLRNRF